MKTEWHRYNLKRRVAQLPPIDECTFNSKIAVNQPPLAKQNIERKPKKNMKDEKKMKNKNKVRAESEGSSSSEPNGPHKDAFQPPFNRTDPSHITEDELVQQKLDKRADIPPTTCLFCSKRHNATYSDINENIEHMSKAHGLYLPEKSYLVDKEGLLTYLGQKVGFGNVCLVCSYQGKDVEAVREHMRSKRHMRIPYENEEDKLELSEFYDFRQTYESSQSVKDTAGAESDWEDVSDDNEVEDEDFFNVNEDPILDMGDELLLPSGAIVRHRTISKYKNTLPEKILSEGQGTVIAAESRHFFKPKDTVFFKQQQIARREKKRMENLHDKRQQKHINFQPHFRDQLLQ